jgi:hypothetical protein
MRLCGDRSRFRNRAVTIRCLLAPQANSFPIARTSWGTGSLGNKADHLLPQCVEPLALQRWRAPYASPSGVREVRGKGRSRGATSSSEAL